MEQNNNIRARPPAAAELVFILTGLQIIIKLGKDNNHKLECGVEESWGLLLIIHMKVAFCIHPFYYKMQCCV